MRRWQVSVALGVIAALAAACGSDSERERRSAPSPAAENQRREPARTQPTPSTTRLVPPTPPDPAMFGCTGLPDGLVDCPSQLAYDLLADEWDAYNRQLAIWKGLAGQQDYIEPSPEDIYGSPDDFEPYENEPYLDEPADPYGFDEGPYP